MKTALLMMPLVAMSSALLGSREWQESLTSKPHASMRARRKTHSFRKHQHSVTKAHVAQAKLQEERMGNDMAAASRMEKEIFKMVNIANSDKSRRESMADFAEIMMTQIDRMDENLNSSFSNSQALINSHQQAFHDCAATRTTAESDIEEFRGIRSNRSSAHKSCRATEATKRRDSQTCENARQGLESTKTTACDTWEATRDRRGSCEDVPDSGSMSYPQWVAAVAAWASGEERSTTRQEESCTNTTNLLNEKTEECHGADGNGGLRKDWSDQQEACNTIQGELESAACSLAGSIVDSCTDYGTCYETAHAAWLNDEPSLRSQEESFQSTHWMLQRLRCYVRVIIDAGSSDIASEDIDACKTQEHDTSAMQFTWFTVPEAPSGGCASTEKVPCTTAYIAEEYGDLHADSPAAECRACPAIVPPPHAVVVSGAGFSLANGVYNLADDLSGGFRVWRKDRCGISWQENWGWGIGCDGHHRYMARECTAETPAECTFTVRDGHGEEPVPTVVILRHSEQAEWPHLEGVAQVEGDGVGDISGAVTFEVCRDFCAGHPECHSFALGDHGCHLKSRCISPSDPVNTNLVSSYRTYFRPCSADFESRPATAGTCGRWNDAMDTTLGDRSHTVVMALTPADGPPPNGRRQWMFNLGQSGTGADHWLINSAHSRFQFGGWSTSPQAFPNIEFTPGVNTVASIWDTESNTYTVYLNGEEVASVSPPHLSITSTEIGVGTARVGEGDFSGCIYGVDIYRSALDEERLHGALAKIAQLAPSSL